MLDEYEVVRERVARYQAEADAERRVKAAVRAARAQRAERARHDGRATRSGRRDPFRWLRRQPTQETLVCRRAAAHYGCAA